MSPPDLFYGHRNQILQPVQLRHPHPRRVTPRIQEMIDRFEESNPTCVGPHPREEQGGTADDGGAQDQGGITDDATLFYEEPTINLDKAFPRLPVTQSMLYAHADLRGRFGDREGDPVHHALFLVKDRIFGAQRIWIPITHERDLWTSLGPGFKLYWDPLVPKPNSLPSTPVEVPWHWSRSKKGKPITLLEHMAQYPATVGKNHYKGEQVYQNFGYCQDQDTKQWFDPESSRPLKEKYIFHQPSDHEEERYKDDGPCIPDFHRSENSGPRIMSQEEQDNFYTEYLDYVHDDVDAEGDPRDLRISPAVFAQWAQGARKGKAYMEETFTPDSIIWSQRVNPPRSPLRDIFSIANVDKAQFDIETGERISDLSTEKDDDQPTFITEAEGVNVLIAPREFTRMLPAVARRIDRLAFGPAPFDNDNMSQSYLTPSETVSDPTVFEEERAYQNLGQTGDLESGKAEFQQLEEILTTLRKTKFEAFATTAARNTEILEMRNQLIDLQREIYFLNQLKPQPLPVPKGVEGLLSTNADHDADAGYNASVSNESDYSTIPNSPHPPSPSPSPRKPKPKKQFRRYFNEEFRKDQTYINQNTTYGKLQDGFMVKLGEETEKLKLEMERLIRAFGVGDVRELGFEVPRPSDKSRIAFDNSSFEGGLGGSKGEEEGEVKVPGRVPVNADTFGEASWKMPPNGNLPAHGDTYAEAFEKMAANGKVPMSGKRPVNGDMYGEGAGISFGDRMKERYGHMSSGDSFGDSFGERMMKKDGKGYGEECAKVYGVGYDEVFGEECGEGFGQPHGEVDAEGYAESYGELCEASYEENHGEANGEENRQPYEEGYEENYEEGHGEDYQEDYQRPYAEDYANTNVAYFEEDLYGPD